MTKTVTTYKVLEVLNGEVSKLGDLGICTKSILKVHKEPEHIGEYWIVFPKISLFFKELRIHKSMLMEKSCKLSPFSESYPVEIVHTHPFDNIQEKSFDKRLYVSSGAENVDIVFVFRDDEGIYQDTESGFQERYIITRVKEVQKVPWRYALLPFSVIADTILSPAYLLIYMFGDDLGDMH